VTTSIAKLETQPHLRRRFPIPAAAPNCLPQPQTLDPQIPASTTNTENHSK